MPSYFGSPPTTHAVYGCLPILKGGVGYERKISSNKYGSRGTILPINVRATKSYLRIYMFWIVFGMLHIVFMRKRG